MDMHQRIASGEFNCPLPLPKSITEPYEPLTEEERESALTYSIAHAIAERTFEQACLEDVGLSRHPNRMSILIFAYNMGRFEGTVNKHVAYEMLKAISTLFYHNGRVLNAHMEIEDIKERIEQKNKR